MVWQSAAETAANDVVDMPIIRAAAVLAIISLFMDPFPFFEVTRGNSRVPQTVGEQRPHARASGEAPPPLAADYFAAVQNLL
jgi:hypothetical protein